MKDVTVWMAFFGGVASFISPCCLPLYPSYLSYMTGISVGHLKAGADKKETQLRSVAHAVCFSLGFSVVFFTLGWSAGLVKDLFIGHKDLIRQLSAILILVMGLVMLGVFKPQLLMKERKLSLPVKPAGYVGSFIIGIGFAAGWSPCVGPILSGILALSLTSSSGWLPFMAAYSFGFALPFIALAFFIGSARKLLRYSNLLMKAGGAVMLLIAFLLYTDQMTRITIWFNEHTPSWLRF